MPTFVSLILASIIGFSYVAAQLTCENSFHCPNLMNCLNKECVPARDFFLARLEASRESPSECRDDFDCGEIGRCRMGQCTFAWSEHGSYSSRRSLPKCHTDFDCGEQGECNLGECSFAAIRRMDSERKQMGKVCQNSNDCEGGPQHVCAKFRCVHLKPPTLKFY